MALLALSLVLWGWAYVPHWFHASFLEILTNIVLWLLFTIPCLIMTVNSLFISCLLNCTLLYSVYWYNMFSTLFWWTYSKTYVSMQIFSARRGQWRAATQSQEFFRTLQRYYSNAWMDAEKQDAINVYVLHSCICFFSVCLQAISFPVVGFIVCLLSICYGELLFRSIQFFLKWKKITE